MATTQIQTVGSGADKIKLAAAALLVLLALTAFYMLVKQGPLVQWSVLLVCVVASAAVFFSAHAGRQLIGFGQDAWREVRKVVWPARKEAMQITAYVFGFVLLMALFLWLTDKTLEWLFYELILGWKK